MTAKTDQPQATDRIEKRFEVKATRSRVWRAISDAGEFGAWFGMTLGLGWSATMVAGSTLLSESVSGELRASAQGLSDLTMGLAGASAGAISGVIVEAWGYPTLTLLAALAAAPLIVLLLVSPDRGGDRPSSEEAPDRQGSLRVQAVRNAEDSPTEPA